MNTTDSAPVFQTRYKITVFGRTGALAFYFTGGGNLK